VDEIVEKVVRVFRRLALLLVAEDEVDPVVQVEGHVLALERQAVDADELGAAVVRPGRQGHVANDLTVLFDAEIVAWMGFGWGTAHAKQQQQQK